jgi:hypothetical protein
VLFGVHHGFFQSLIGIGTQSCEPACCNDCGYVFLLYEEVLIVVFFLLIIELPIVPKVCSEMVRIILSLRKFKGRDV